MRKLVSDQDTKRLSVCFTEKVVRQIDAYVDDNRKTVASRSDAIRVAVTRLLASREASKGVVEL